VSRATPELGLRDLKQVLRRSREHNFRAQVTGYLVYDGTSFLQLLEGSGEALDAVMARIEADPRHRELTVLLREPIADRCFDGWAMGCTNLAAAAHVDTRELRARAEAFVTGERRPVSEAQAFFRDFVAVRTPEQAALLSL
jgi:hypothetical protein